MSELYTTIEREASAEFEEKRSVFFGHIAPAKTEVEAMAFVKSKQSEFRDATHNVWAYYMNNGVLARYSDDGEPTGTAGLPTLEAIRKSGVQDVCVVVTRYFGGILLGAGGLVRAYSKAASLAIEAAGIVTYEPFAELTLNCTYSDYQRLCVELPKLGAKTDSADFTDRVFMKIAIKEGLTDGLIAKVSELTAGRTTVAVTGKRLDK